MSKVLFSLLLVLMSATPLHAAPASTSLYDIEVIVFENRMPELEGGELWTRLKPEAVVTDKEEPLVTGEKPPADSPLAMAVEALEKSGRNPVLAHLRWQQSAEAKSVSKPVKITSANGALDGSLRFYLSRQLIVEINLALRELPNVGGSGGEVRPEEKVFRLNEPRRIKVSETHYFDHPKFGALLRVSPAKPADQP